METHRHKPRLLKNSQVSAEAFGQGGWRDCHLLEAEESLVEAESCCQCCDPCTADGVALETEIKGESVRMGQSWYHRWAAGSCLGWKVPISLRKGHLPTSGDRGSQGRRTKPGASRGDQSFLLSTAAPAPAEGTGFASTLGQPCPHLSVTMAAGSAGHVAPVGLGSLSQGQNRATATHHQELSPGAVLSRCCSHGERRLHHSSLTARPQPVTSLLSQFPTLLRERRPKTTDFLQVRIKSHHWVL